MTFENELAALKRAIAAEGIDLSARVALDEASARARARKVASVAVDLGLYEPPPAPAPSTSNVGDLPRPWVTATRDYARGERAGGFARVDRFTTSTAGFDHMLASTGGRYLLPTDVPLLETRLRLGARRLDSSLGDGALDVAAGAMAPRLQRLSVYPLTPAGSQRRALGAALTSDGTKLHAGEDPYGPVHVRPSPFPFKWARVSGPPFDGIRVRYIDVAPPNARGTLLLIHGHGSLLEEYDDLTARLAERYRVIVPDLPGCGYSDKPDARYSVDAYHQFLLAFLRRLGVSRCVPCGGSLGGNLALTLAHGDPGQQLFPKAIAWAPAGWIRPSPALAELAKIGRGAGRHVFFLSYDAQKEYWYSEKWPGRRAALRGADTFRKEVYCRGYHVAYFDIARDQTERSKLALASAITQPVLLMCGKNDHGLGMYETVRGELFPALKAAGTAFQDRFTLGCHSLANEDTAQVASYMTKFLGTF
ncbi:MAG: alpha/beta fold hydrolase [Sandaracinaceae bacterium]|nr:alpha/beta fold hydrolase [Sandaracinaceae bacterium]